MPKGIIIIGSLDTRGEEIKYIKSLIEKRGHKAFVIDVGVLGKIPFEPNITRIEVAQASGSSLEDIIALNNQSKAMEKMAEGASKIVKELHKLGKIDGIIAIGGTMGTYLALMVTKDLPIGLPKLIVSTVAFSPLINLDLVGGDLMMMQWTAGFWGINGICQMVLDTAAGAISGAAEAYYKRDVIKKTVVGITSLGHTVCKYLYSLKPALEQKGYEVAVFHAAGAGRGFEQAIAEGLVDVALDLCAFELVNELIAGVCSAGKHRLEAAGRKGIPQIIAPGSIDIFNLLAYKQIPTEFENRPKRQHNPLIYALGTSWEEKAAVGKLMAEKLNKAIGPVSVIIPMGGFSEYDKPGKLFYDPEGREAFSKALKSQINPNIKVVEVDANINDMAFTNEVLILLDQIVHNKIPY